jgi:hypothetical protein
MGKGGKDIPGGSWTLCSLISQTPKREPAHRRPGGRVQLDRVCEHVRVLTGRARAFARARCLSSCSSPIRAASASAVSWPRTQIEHACGPRYSIHPHLAVDEDLPAATLFDVQLAGLDRHCRTRFRLGNRRASLRVLPLPVPRAVPR